MLIFVKLFRQGSLAAWILFAILLTAAVESKAILLSFEDIPDGSTLSDQYSEFSVLFNPNAFYGSGSPSGDWATNTDMTITAFDLGDLGAPNLVSGKMLRAYDSGWLNEDGDPSFRALFLRPVTFVSADFASVSFGADVRVFVYDGENLLSIVEGPSVLAGLSQFTLSFSAPSITSVVITPGSFNDWVAVDNFSFTPLADITPIPAVPEPSQISLIIAGLAVLSGRKRFVECLRRWRVVARPTDDHGLPIR